MWWMRGAKSSNRCLDILLKGLLVKGKIVNKSNLKLRRCSYCILLHVSLTLEMLAPKKGLVDILDISIPCPQIRSNMLRCEHQRFTWSIIKPSLSSCNLPLPVDSVWSHDGGSPLVMRGRKRLGGTNMRSKKNTFSAGSLETKDWETRTRLRLGPTLVVFYFETKLFVNCTPGKLTYLADLSMLNRKLSQKSSS